MRYSWCLVAYIGANPLYYCGYYKSCQGESLKPVLSVSYDDALKLSSETEAKSLLANMGVSNLRVEEHASVYFDDQIDAPQQVYLGISY